MGAKETHRWAVAQWRLACWICAPAHESVTASQQPRQTTEPHPGDDQGPGTKVACVGALQYPGFSILQLALAEN